MKFTLGKKTFMLGAATTIIVGAIALVVLGAGGIVAWEYSNSDAFCTNNCHAVHPEEPRAHAVSVHARVHCVECHMGRLPTLQLMALKAAHYQELLGMIIGYERPLTATTLRPARDSCENCHWPSVNHDDKIRTRIQFQPDKDNTEVRTKLILHTGSGEAREKATRGIHWHIEQNVEFVSDDVQRRTVPWVRITGNDGKSQTYFDATSEIGRAEMDQRPRRRMDCTDCHNATGHPFRNPADRIDEAMAQGRIDRSIPSIKARALAIIERASPLHGPMEAQISTFKQIIADAAPKGELKPEQKAAEEQFAKTMLEIVSLSEFEAKDFSWKSFPNHVGHRDFPGCFRCHDGKHFNEKGEAIRLQCTLCHDLPQVSVDGTLKTVNSTVAPGLTPPSSHNEPNFMHDHRTKVDDSCKMCHGPIKWGTEGGSFCANPACHGRNWPELSLDSKRN
ncbi:MAG: NapC/NirT family cytochrome c [Burkholderiales bacterium]|nr:NapC/NirT family cytochrome c [Burkholderiales bacterium]